MSEGRRLAPAAAPPPQAQPGGPALPYAYEQSKMEQQGRNTASSRMPQSSSSSAGAMDSSSVLNLHQFIAGSAKSDLGSAHLLGQRMAGGEKVRDAVKSSAKMEQEYRVQQQYMSRVPQYRGQQAQEI